MACVWLPEGTLSQLKFFLGIGDKDKGTGNNCPSPAVEKHL